MKTSDTFANRTHFTEFHSWSPGSSLPEEGLYSPDRENPVHAAESRGIPRLQIVQCVGTHSISFPDTAALLSGFSLSNRYALVYVKSLRPERYSQHGREATVAQGDLVLIDLHAPFSHRPLGHDGMANLHFLLDAQMVESALPDVANLTATRISSQHGWGERLSNYLAGLTPAMLTELSADAELIAVLPQHIVSLLRNAFAATPAPEAAAPEMCEHRALDLHSRAMAWLQENFADERITLPLMAAQLHTSGRHLHRAFAQADAGSTFLKTLHGVRMKEAARILSDRAQRSVPIPEVAARCGIVSPATFYRLFLRAFGMSPAKYRKLFVASASR